MAKLIKSVKVFRSGLVLLAILASGTASAQLPKNNYACMVQTQYGVAGLVMVQADTLDKAQPAAARATADKLGGGQSPAVSVIECIVAGEDRFRDSHFQSFYESFPR